MPPAAGEAGAGRLVDGFHPNVCITVGENRK